MEKDIKHMTECEKLDAGMAYDFWDKGVNDRKLKAIAETQKLNAIDPGDEEAIEACLRRLFGSCGSHPWTGPGFRCDNGSNIHVGDNFLANFNVTILDIGPVHIGDHVMIGPGTLITTVNHPLSPRGRRQHLGIMKPVTIGNDVWLAAMSPSCPASLSAITSSLQPEPSSPKTCPTTASSAVCRQR